MAARSAGSIRISLTAGTAEFIEGMDRANAKVTQFGTNMRQAGAHGVSAVQATSGALRVMEGGLNNNLRAAERFAANVLGLGPILQAAFPLIGGLAFIGLLTKMGEEAKKFYEEMRDAPEKMAGAWRTMSGAGKLSNDELAVSIDKVNLEIAKLEGRRQNTLKLMLDEAKVSADKLASSLTKAFGEFAKFLDENKVGAWRQFTGEGSTYDVRMMAGGHTGTAGIQDKLDAAQKAGTLAIARANNEKELGVAETQRDVALHQVLNKELADAERLMRGYVEASKPVAPRAVKTISGSTVYTEGGPGQNKTTEIAQMQMYIDKLKEQDKAIDYDAELRTATRRRDKDVANNVNEKQDRPFDKQIAELREQIAGASAKLKAAGLDEAQKVIAKAEADALKAIQHVNEGLERQHARLIDMKNPFADVRGAEILSLTTTRDKTEAESAWQTKVKEVRDKIEDQIKTQWLLNAAIGQGYEAQKKVNVEMALMKEFGASAYNDPSRRAAVDAARPLAAAAEEAKHAESISKTSEQLREQISLETRLAQVQIQGEAAVRLATLQHNLALLMLKENSKELIDLEIKRFQAQQANQTSAAVAKIQEQIQATERLAAAQVEGAEAVRKAQLENKYAEIRNKGGALMPGAAGMTGMTVQEANARVADEMSHAEQIAAKVSERVNVFKNELDVLNQEKASLIAMAAIFGSTIDTARALRDIEDQRLKIVVQETLANRSAADGVKAFFIEMQEQAKSAAQVMYEALNSVLDRVSDNFAKFLTRQKTDWAKTFQEIGQSMLKNSIKSGLQTGLGAIGKKIPGVQGTIDKLGLGGKNDGSSEARALWVRVAGFGGNSGAGYGGSKNGQIIGNGGILGTGQVPTANQPYGEQPQQQTGGFLGFLKKLAGLGGPKSTGSSGGDGGSNPMGQWDFSGLGDASGGAGDAAVGLGDEIGMMAGGGSVTAGDSVLVGERGPEIMRAASNVSIFSNSASRRMGGGGSNHFYSIDARGTDPVQTEIRVKAAIKAAHGDAIVTSAQAQHDHARRVPRAA